MESDRLKITLATNNKVAKRIKDDRMAGLDSEAFVYTAIHEGDTRTLKDSVESELLLKEGAQVMFTRNDSLSRWVNGTLGTVKKLTQDGIVVKLDNDVEVDVDKAVWEVVEQEYNKEKKTCERRVVGRLQQYPLRLAWAITIHKSQGLTFDRVAIDLGPGAGIIRELISENPNYDRYYQELRWMLWDDEEACSEAKDSENKLVKAMFDRVAPDSKFMQMLSREREFGTAEYVSFRKFVNGLKLALGY